MTGKPKLSKEEQKDLVDLVRNQINLYLCGEVERLFSNKELGEVYNIGGRTSYSYLNLNLNLNKEDLHLRYICMIRKRRSEVMIKLHKDPKFKENHRKIMIEYFKDPEYKKRSISGFKKLHKDPKFKEKSRIRMVELNKNKEFKIKKKERNRELMIRLNKNKKFKEKNIEWGKTLSKLYRRNAYFVENRFHASSQQEGVVALLLEKYILGMGNIKEGLNFQIENKGINNGGIDFLIDKEFLEWHPLILYCGRRGDILSKNEEKSYRKILIQLLQNEKKEFEEQYKQVLGINYRNKRQESINKSDYKGLEVKLATNVQELYNFISKQLLIEQLSSFEDFKSEFNKLVKYIKTFKVTKPKPKIKINLLKNYSDASSTKDLNVPLTEAVIEL